MAVRRQVRAHDIRELESLWDWIHDAGFSTADVRWDRDARTVVIPIANYCDDPDFPAPKPAGKWLFARTVRRPWFRAALSIRRVRTMQPEPAELIEPGSLSDLEWITEHSLLRVHSNTDQASFEIEVDEFDVELVVTDEIDHWRRHRYARFGNRESHGPALSGRHP